MAINKKLIHFKTKQKFNEELAKGNILNISIVFIQDTNEIYTHGTFYDGSKVDLSNIESSIQNILQNKQDVISDLAAIRSGANAGATAVQPTSLASVATSGSYNDLNGKPSLNEVNGILSIEKGGTGATTPEDARSNLDVYSKAEINELLISNEIDLPNGYTELEYIESTGTQYIDTGFIANQDTRVIIDAKFKTVPTNYEAIFGSRNGDAQGFWLYYRPAQGMFAYRYGSTGTNYFVNADPLVQNEFDANKNKITVGGNFATAPEDTFNCASTLYLFAVNATTSIGYTSKLIMYSCRIYDNGTLVRNFIPCINSADEIGMYDLVNEVFYGNAGSGEFLSGPTVLKNVTPIEQGGTGATNAADARANLGITPANIGAPTVGEMNTALNGKQDTISDLDTIRTGAAKGATAYQKPENGIPASDLSTEVKESLGGNSGTPLIEFSGNEIVLEANKYYKTGEVDVLLIILDESSQNTNSSVYTIEFASGLNPTSLTLPNNIKWDKPLVILSNTRYRLTITNGLGEIESFPYDNVNNYKCLTFIPQGNSYLKITPPYYEIERAVIDPDTGEETGELTYETFFHSYEWSLNGVNWIKGNGELIFDGFTHPVILKAYYEQVNKDTSSYYSTSWVFDSKLSVNNKTYDTVKLDGSPMSLIYGDAYYLYNTSIPDAYIFKFYGSNAITEILNPETFLPATNLYDDCYHGMFQSCSSLVNAPELPATNVMMNCYRSMFAGCRSLVNAPELPATNTSAFCYEMMFENCVSLLKAPTELPATSLKQGCYSTMFRGCIALTKAPDIPNVQNNGSVTLNRMFYGCSNLNYVKAMFITDPGKYTMTDWLYGVSPTGTFVKNKDATWNRIGTDGIPDGWTVLTE